MRAKLPRMYKQAGVTLSAIFLIFGFQNCGLASFTGSSESASHAVPTGAPGSVPGTSIASPEGGGTSGYDGKTYANFDPANPCTGPNKANSVITPSDDKTRFLLTRANCQPVTPQVDVTAQIQLQGMQTDDLGVLVYQNRLYVKRMANDSTFALPLKSCIFGLAPQGGPPLYLMGPTLNSTAMFFSDFSVFFAVPTVAGRIVRGFSNTGPGAMTGLNGQPELLFPGNGGPGSSFIDEIDHATMHSFNYVQYSTMVIDQMTYRAVSNPICWSN